MGTIYKGLGITALLAGAWLLHSFYTEYVVSWGEDQTQFVVSWKSTPGAHERVLDHIARSNVLPERTDRSGSFVFPAVTYEDALVKARREHPTSRSGIVPSNASAGDSPSPRDRTNTLWFGVITPTAMILAALALLISTLGPWLRGRRGTQHLAPQTAPARATQTPARQQTLADRLKSAFGPDLPVAVGEATQDSPLVITDRRDYVSIEYAIAKHLLVGQEWKFARQSVANSDGRAVDELVFTVRDGPDGQWTERSFFFDVSAGYNRR